MSGRKALVVIDMQNDYLWERRKQKFSYPTEALVRAVNRAIELYAHLGHDILYVSQVFPNLPTNRWLIGFSIQGTPGAALYDGLTLASDLRFDKRLPDAYTAPAFRAHMAREGYAEIALCGLDECGCIAATARGAVKRGTPVIILENCAGRRFPGGRVSRTRQELTALGVRYGQLETVEAL